MDKVSSSRISSFEKGIFLTDFEIEWLDRGWSGGRPLYGSALAWPQFWSTLVCWIAVHARLLILRKNSSLQNHLYKNFFTATTTQGRNLFEELQYINILSKIYLKNSEIWPCTSKWRRDFIRIRFTRRRFIGRHFYLKTFY